MNIPINSLIRYLNNPASETTSGKLFRVICSFPSAIVLYPILEDREAYPISAPREKVESELKNRIAFIEQYDPYLARLVIQEEKMSEKAKKIQDRAYNMVISIVEKDGEFNIDILDYRKRAQLIIRAAKEFNVGVKTVRRNLRKYWHDGMTRDALLPNLDNCGAPGGTHIQREKKIGRKNAVEKDEGRITPLYNGEQQRMIMFEALEKYYKPKAELFEILSKIHHEYFALPGETYINDQGVEVPVLVAEELRLTYKQLHYFFTKEFNKDPIKYLKMKKGERKYNQESKPSLDGSTDHGFGPGSIYQIDSTPLDVFLVMTTDRYHIIGKPTVYVISDVFSRAVVGFCLTMENASWGAALLAMDNAFSNKVNFCAEYGIHITEAQWPMEGLPKRFLADNAEMRTHLSKHLDEKLGIKVSNTAAYTPEWKAIIEKRIDLTNKIVKEQPGGESSPKKRGDPLGRELACLTPYEATQILILGFLFYNNHHLLSKKYYQRSQDMIVDKVHLIPSVLWAWGIANRTGQLRQENRDKVMLTLLHHDMGSITESGFLFDQNIYHAQDRAFEERLAVLAKAKGRKKLQVVWDPRRPEMIYVQFENRKSLIPLFLNEKDRGLYGQHEMEWDEQNILDKKQELELKGKEEQERVSLNATVNVISSQASRETKKAVDKQGGKSKRRIKNMEKNREIELESERRSKPLLPAPDSLSKEQEFKNHTENTEKESKYIPPPSNEDFIEKIEEELNNDD